VTSLDEILDEQDARDLHGQSAPIARVNHLGLSSRSVADVFAAVRAHPRPAVRSGHIGNWSEIWAGRVGLIDYNRYICRDFGMGRPLLHAHTFTETADLSDGDTIYLPAGRIRHRRHERIDVHVKEDDTFRPLAEGESVCCAFAYAPADGGMTSLLHLRAAELAGIPGATTIPTFLTRDVPLVRRALTGLLEATQGPTATLPLDHLFGASVSRQGARGRAPRRTGTGFRVEDTDYPTGRALVDAAIEALRYGSLEQTDLQRQRQPVGQHLPLLGATAVLALVAYVDCYGAGDASGSQGVHAHWGAISMSGYPPLAGGYFGRRANRRTLRQIGEALATMPEFAGPLRFALLPAPLLSLLAPAEFDGDRQLVDALIGTVLDSTDPPAADPSRALREITDVVHVWLDKHRADLSPYYLNRFGRARSVFNGTEAVPSDGRPAESGLLGRLTMQQASMLLGALIAATTAAGEKA